jgi:hypothetical protein
MKPILIPYRNGGVNIGDKYFTREDVKCGIILRKSLIADDNWFGGNVYAFGKTVDGFLLCMGGQLDDTGEQYPNNEVIGVYIPTLDGLSGNAIEMLTKAGYLTPMPEPIAVPEPLPFEPENIEEIEEPEPITLAKEAEIISKVTEIVNKKVAARPRRVTKAGKGKKR